MKRKTIVFVSSLFIAIVFFTSGQTGAGYEKIHDGTGAESGSGNFTGCSEGSGCHGSIGGFTSGITVSLELDSSGVPTTHYVGGHTYTIKITGTNTTANTLAKFGFQIACIKGTSSLPTPLNAGYFDSVSLPAGVRYTHAVPVGSPNNFVCNLVEQNAPLLPTTGTGGTGTIYSASATWTAPPSGTGAISIWGVINAIYPDGYANFQDKWNNNYIFINEWPTTTSVNNTVIGGINCYPNPLTNTLNISHQQFEPGTYTLTVFNNVGIPITKKIIEMYGISCTTLNTSDWPSGIYQVVIENKGVRKVTSIVK